MITGIEILKTEPVSGLTFGKTGAYEKVTGVATGELDPKLPMNKVIVDLDKAPLNARGKVDYKTDFVVMRPVDFSKGNGRMLYATTNRGGKQLFGHVGDAESDAGDLAEASALHRHRCRTGMVFQQHHLIGRLTVLDNVLMGRLGHHRGWCWLEYELTSHCKASDTANRQNYHQ